MDKITKKKLVLSPADKKRLALYTPSGGSAPDTATRQRLKHQCNNRANWSDGGNWIGHGQRPSCTGSTFTGSSTILYTFPTDLAAFKWNTEWEKAIRETGHLATGVVAITVGLATAGWGSIGVGIIAAVAKDELQAMVSYPKVARGWSYRFTVTHIYRWSPHPHGKNSYTQEFTGLVFDTEKNLQQKSITKIEIGFDAFPESLAMKLASAPGKIRNVVYGD